jgi:hypothetical protein
MSETLPSLPVFLTAPELPLHTTKTSCAPLTKPTPRSPYPIPLGPHSVAAAARDVLGLLRRLRLYPNMLIGHSFGGKARNAAREAACLSGCLYLSTLINLMSKSLNGSASMADMQAHVRVQNQGLAPRPEQETCCDCGTFSKVVQQDFAPTYYPHQRITPS